MLFSFITSVTFQKTLSRRYTTYQHILMHRRLRTILINTRIVIPDQVLTLIIVWTYQSVVHWLMLYTYLTYKTKFSRVLCCRWNIFFYNPTQAMHYNFWSFKSNSAKYISIKQDTSIEFNFGNQRHKWLFSWRNIQSTLCITCSWIWLGDMQILVLFCYLQGISLEMYI